MKRAQEIKIKRESDHCGMEGCTTCRKNEYTYTLKIRRNLEIEICNQAAKYLGLDKFDYPKKETEYITVLVQLKESK